jgi:hypothetical protein
MAANPKSLAVSESVRDPYHVYHAHAFVLKGEFEQPIKRPILPFGEVILEQTRRDTLITQQVSETNIEGLISFKRGHARVVGTHVKQKVDIFGRNHAGWTTLSSAHVEGYNVLDVITADRVVAQITTDHTLTGDNKHPVHNVPRVSFLGTTFENLKIGGVPVEVELNLAFCGPKPENDRAYLEDEKFLDNVHRQLDDVVSSRDLPETLGKKYTAEIAYIDDLKRRAKDKNKAGAEGGPNGYPKLRCSLVKKITLAKEIPGVHTFGNLIFLEDFGTVSLADIEVGIHKAHHHFGHGSGDGQSASGEGHYFTLNMMAIRLGCGNSGNTDGPSAMANGQGTGPGH